MDRIVDAACVRGSDGTDYRQNRKDEAQRLIHLVRDATNVRLVVIHIVNSMQEQSLNIILQRRNSIKAESKNLILLKGQLLNQIREQRKDAVERWVRDKYVA